MDKKAYRSHAKHGDAYIYALRICRPLLLSERTRCLCGSYVTRCNTQELWPALNTRTLREEKTSTRSHFITLQGSHPPSEHARIHTYIETQALSIRWISCFNRLKWCLRNFKKSCGEDYRKYCNMTTSFFESESSKRMRVRAVRQSKPQRVREREREGGRHR